jgi:hypothetical protein
MSSFPSLPELPSLSGGGSSDSSGGQSAAPAASGPSWLTGDLAQYVTIGLGLILIIAGLFQFKTVQTATGYAAKAGAAAAV